MIIIILAISFNLTVRITGTSIVVVVEFLRIIIKSVGRKQNDVHVCLGQDRVDWNTCDIGCFGDIVTTPKGSTLVGGDFVQG
jgi:hypothetical protein